MARIFQTTWDSEIIIQLIAHSKAGTLVDALRIRCGRWKARFRL